jgi:serine/threonine-protein kinase
MKSPTPLQKIGKYQIESILGKGAMGVVYKAYDPDLKQPVAVKTIRKELLDPSEPESQKVLERFKNEAIAGRRLKHPNIVSIYEYGREEDIWYLVMEFVQGRSLREYFEGGHLFTLDEAIQIMRQLLDALGYAHQHGVVHRDIKPANILLMEKGQIQVTDFGIAKIDASSALTKTGAVLGTPSYMSPEQCIGQQVDHRSDLFSAGIIFYQLLTGEKPFHAETLVTSMHKVMNLIPISPSYLNVHVPPALDDVVSKAMAKRPDERFQSAKEFMEELHLVWEDAAGTVNKIESEELSSAGRVLSNEESAVLESTLSLNGTADEATLMELPATPVIALAADSSPPLDQSIQASSRKGPSIMLTLGSGGILAGAIALWFLSGPWPKTEIVSKPSKPAPAEEIEPVISQPSAFDQAALDRLLASFSCARLEVAKGEDGKLLVKGHIQPNDLAKLQRELGAVAGGVEITSKIETLAWPYCELIDTLTPFKHEGGSGSDLLVGPAEHAPHYVEGEKLVLALTAPSYDAYLYVDYYQLDGGVVHLFPTEPNQHKPYPANQRLILGDSGEGNKEWQVQPPFGTEMIVIVATREAIFETIRPEVESAKDYLPTLREAMKRLGKEGTAADYIYITTEAATVSKTSREERAGAAGVPSASPGMGGAK